MCKEQIFCYGICQCQWAWSNFTICYYHVETKWGLKVDCRQCPFYCMVRKHILSGNGLCRLHGGESEAQQMIAWRKRRQAEAEREEREEEAKAGEKKKGWLGKLFKKNKESDSDANKK